MDVRSESAPPVRRGDVWAVAAALVVALVLTLVLGRAVRLTGVPALLVADLCVWVPLLAAVWFAVRGMRPADGRRRLGLGIGVVDVVFGIAAACIARAFDAFLQLATTGDTGLHPMPVLSGVSMAGLAAMAIIGPCIVSPVLEELVFRGVLQRGIAARNSGGFWGQASAVLIAAFVFALAHVLLGSTLGSGAVLTTFVLGLLLGALTAWTGRIGGAIVAHVLFNVIAVVLTWSY